MDMACAVQSGHWQNSNSHHEVLRWCVPAALAGCLCLTHVTSLPIGVHHSGAAAAIRHAFLHGMKRPVGGYNIDGGAEGTLGFESTGNKGELDDLTFLATNDPSRAGGCEQCVPL